MYSCKSTNPESRNIFSNSDMGFGFGGSGLGSSFGVTTGCSLLGLRRIASSYHEHEAHQPSHEESGGFAT
ncbi:MAG: hypothetical protein U0176_01450 [Bacteroidia bacterium]